MNIKPYNADTENSEVRNEEIENPAYQYYFWGPLLMKYKFKSSSWRRVYVLLMSEG